MENQIVLTGKEALRYRQLHNEIEKIDSFRVNCPKASELIGIVSHIFTLHEYIRDTAVALGLDANYSKEVDLKIAKSHIENALHSIPSGFKTSNWIYEISYLVKCTEALEWFTTEVNE